MVPAPTSPPPDKNMPLGRSAMHDRYSGPVRRIFERLFGPIHYPAEGAAKIGDLARQGAIVYVAHAQSVWLALYFNHALARLGLPLATFVGGVNLLLWQPIGRVWKLWQRRQAPRDTAWEQRFADRPPSRSESLLADTLRRGQAAFLFLRRSRSLHRKSTDQQDYFRCLIAMQRLSNKPIFVVPHVVTDRSEAGSTRAGIPRMLLGHRRRGGRLRELGMLLGVARRAAVRVADPIDLKRLCDEFPDTDDQLLARRLSHDVHKKMIEEERVIAGPELPGHDDLERHVLRDPNVRRVLDQASQSIQKSIAELERQVRANLREIAARYNVGYIKMMDRGLGVIFNRIYDGLLVDEPGLAQVFEAARRGPVILCPCHRSHIDYLVMSYVLWQHGVAPPHIAAGANLSFFPLGTIFRRAGAFFLRRTFRDDPVYGATFRAYITELVKNGTSIEFFLEGTRSRTGKLLLPKFGLLGMIVEAWRRGYRPDVQFVPVSIDYERIIEAGSYEHELAGGEKKPENVRGLLGSAKVLRSRYGRVHIQFAGPISLSEYAKQQNLEQRFVEDESSAWNLAVERLGFRILHQVAMVTSVTPSSVVATALLGHVGRGMAEGILLERARAIIEFLENIAARIAEPLQSRDTRQETLLVATRALVDTGSVNIERAGKSDMEPIYTIPETKRLVLDYHKNALMNYFAPAALVARALLKRGLTTAAYNDVRQDTLFLSRLFKFEFMYRADARFETYFNEALDVLCRIGYLQLDEQKNLNVQASEATQHLASLLDNFVEAYWMVAATLTDLRQFPLWDKELKMRALEKTRRAFLEGKIRRPEAANRTLIDNAVLWFADQKIIEMHKDGKRQNARLASTYEGDGLELLITQISEFSRR